MNSEYPVIQPNRTNRKVSNADMSYTIKAHMVTKSSLFSVEKSYFITCIIKNLFLLDVLDCYLFKYSSNALLKY